MGEKIKGGRGLLIGILVGVAAGAVLGAVGGRSMWIATGRVSADAKKMAQAAVQKELFAQRHEEKAREARKNGETETAAGEVREAERLRGHIALIRVRERELLWTALAQLPDYDAQAQEALQKLAAATPILEKARDLRRAADEAAAAGDVAEARRLTKEAQREKAAGLKHLRGLQKLDKTRKVLGKLEADGVLFGTSFVGVFATLCEFAGQIFLRCLFMLVIPLVVATMVVGIVSLGDIRHLGRTGGRTLVYYMITTSIAVLIGIILVLVIRPGKSADDTYALVKESALEKERTTALDTVLDVFRGAKDSSGKRKEGGGMFPRNLFRSATEMNVLGIIVFALVFGAVLSTLGEQGKPVVQFFHVLNEIVMKMVHLVMYLAPVGIFGLVLSKIVESGGGAHFLTELGRLGLYALTVILGLTIHAFVVLPLLLSVFARRSPVPYALGMSRALLTALSTASSSATLPITMECATENNQVSEKSCSFVLPLGATINMDGTALYEAVAVIFIAQSLGVELSLGHLIVIFLTATLAAIGAAGIPEAGLVTMVIVLAAVGLDTQGIGTILAIDWFLDRCRTTVNVWGDSVGAAIVDRYEKQEESSESSLQSPVPIPAGT